MIARKPTLRAAAGTRDGTERRERLISPDNAARRLEWSSLRADLARRLESDRPPGLPARLLASAWSAVSASGLARPLALPSSVYAIGVGGATLGGSCKTPFAIALARALAARGIRVALVGHAYRARPRHPRIVRPDDDVAEVGDDALFAARQLAVFGIDVIVAPNRQSAANFAGRRARCLIFDGLLQARPKRLARSILLLDAAGSLANGHCPPAGDLRAPPRALLDAADGAVSVEDERANGASGLAVPHAISELEQAIDGHGRSISLSDLRRATTGLLLAIARPGRVVESLERREVRPVAIWTFADHHRPSPAELEVVAVRTTHRIDAWLTTGKCATKLPPRLAGAPVLALDHTVRLSGSIVDDLFPIVGAVR